VRSTPPDTDLEIRRCTFTENKADGGGGGVYANGPGTIIEDCIFIRNSGWRDGFGGALHLGPGVNVQRCVFFANTAYNGGGAVYGGARILDCVFVNNDSSYEHTGAYGGSEYVGCTFNKSSVLLRNGSIVNCTLLGSAVEIHYWSDWARITNSILGGPPRVQPPGPFPTVTNCYLQSITPLYSGNGNIGGSPSVSPRFADPDGPDNIPGTLDDDLRLLPGSPCIDAGDSTALPPDILSDLAGNPRYFDDPGMPDAGSLTPPVIDMGAYEFQGTSCLADFNGDGVVSGSDNDQFTNLFAIGDRATDLNRDGFVDGIDYDLFQNVFEAGC
jgi:predicted outer membrane repeat protein